jgi:hypothetical protein
LEAFMRNLIRAAVVVTSLAGSSLVSADGPPDGGEHHGPNPAAVAACKDKSEGDACTFEGHHGTVEGACHKDRAGDLACFHPHPHHDGSGK